MSRSPMKVLLVSLFHPELVRGGAQQVCYELFQGLLQLPDVEPVLLASVDASLPALYKSGARITGFDRRPNEFLFLSRDYDYTWHRATNGLMIEAYVDFLRLIRPDVVHFHHFLTLGIDLITITRRTLPEARIVFTFHEFLAICAADGQMVRRTDKSLCSKASAVRCHQCMPELSPDHFFLREMWMKKHFEAVDVFTTPTRFMVEHYANWGIPRERIAVVTNGQADYSGGGALPRRAGGAQPLRLLRPARRQQGRAGHPRGGRAAQEQRLHRLRRRDQRRQSALCQRGAAEGARSLPRAGGGAAAARPQRRHERLLSCRPAGQRMARIDWCIVPSVWWEIFGLVISEAWMFGRPVIASNVGGMKERIRDGVDGLHFNVGDARSLAETMRRAATEDGLWEQLVDGITPPPSREEMTEEYLEIYESTDMRMAVGA